MTKRLKNIYSTLSFSFLLMCLVGISTTSCYKDPTFACRIYVEDTTGLRIDCTATVRVYAPVAQTEIDHEKKTDLQGKAEFTFGNDAVLEVEVTTEAGQTGDGFIQLEPNETVTETIVVR